MEDKMSITLQEAIKKFTEQSYDTVKVKGGKNYIQVKDRLNFVREQFGDRASIITKTNHINGLAEFHSEFWLDNKLIATGNSREINVGEKSYEKHETVAVGRCLAFAGFAGTELASADEMREFISQQSVVHLKPVETKPMSNQEEVANDVIGKLEQAAKYSKTPTALEKQKELILGEYRKELENIKISNATLFDKIKNRYTTLKQEKETNQHGR